MGFKYHSLPVAKERPLLDPDDSSSTTDDLDNLDALSDYELDSGRLPGAKSFVRENSSPNWFWLVHAVLLITSFTFFILAATMRPSTLQHVREFSAWSPADTSIRYYEVTFNTSTKSNRFVGAGPDVDRAWREISYDMGDQWISKNDFAKLGMAETSLKVDHPETGEEGYRVGVEAFHQLHCINLLRRVTYKEYYEPLGGEFAAGPEALQHHTDHCLEILRLNTQCNADVGVFTFYMIPDDLLAWPELNSKHVCRDFDRVMEWALDHSVGNMELLSL